jgi:hypothetical protein
MNVLWLLQQFIVTKVAKNSDNLQVMGHVHKLGKRAFYFSAGHSKCSVGGMQQMAHESFSDSDAIWG